MQQRKPRVMLAAVLIMLLGSVVSAPAQEAPAGTEAARKKIAILATSYHVRSHADVLGTKFIEGFVLDDGTVVPPEVDVVSIWVDAGQKDDVAQALSEEHGIPLYATVAEALTLGGDKLAVDGVLFVGEHGDYARNRFGSKMYPRVRVMDEVFTVFEKSGEVAPVFVDKMLSHNWIDAHWIVNRAADLGVPLMAGSSLPVSRRLPELEHPVGVKIEEAVAVGYGPTDAYGFHVLEMLQSMLERRAGGETGVASVRAVRGPAVYELADQGIFSLALVEAVIEDMAERRPGELRENERNPTAFLITYRDGTRATVLMIGRHIRESWGYAARLADGSVVHSEFQLDSTTGEYTHFTYLGLNAQQMFVTGKPVIPAQRTLLTSVVLDAALRSLAQDGAEISVPQLQVSYQPLTTTPIRPGIDGE